jgi:ferredoxin
MISVVREEDPDKQIMMLRSRASADLFESVLRGGGIITGCRRCGEVCPVGEDYERSLKQWVDQIPEATAEKQQRLAAMSAAEENGERPAVYAEQARWIGRLD